MFRSRIPWRSTAHSFHESKAPEFELKNPARRNGKVDSFKSLTTSGDVYSGENRGESVIKSLQIKIVNALSLGDRSKASSLLSDLGHGCHSIKADDFVFVLDYCSKSPDPLFVLETWRIMMEKEIDVNYRCCLLAVRALCKGGYLKEALNLMDFLREDHNTYPILPMYNSLLSACAQTRSYHYAQQCLELMESQVIGRNDKTYLPLLKLAVWQRNLSAVHEIWKEYIKYYNLSVNTLQNFIWSFTRLGDLKSAYAILQQMVDLAFKRSMFIINPDDENMYSSRLDIPIPSTNETNLSKDIESDEYITSSFNVNCEKNDMQIDNTDPCTTLGVKIGEMKVVGIDRLDKMKSFPFRKILRWSFNDVISACAQAQNYELSQQLMLQMEDLGLKPSSYTYNCFIRPLVSEKGFTAGMEVLKLMEERNLKPYDSTFATVSAGYSKGLVLDLAEALLDQISKSKNAYAFNAFFEACDKLDQPERAVGMFGKMKKLGVKPDMRTYEVLFSLFGNLNAPYEDGNMVSQAEVAKRITSIETDMLINGIQHSHCSMMNLLKALGREGMIPALIQYLRVAEDQLCRSNTIFGTHIYNIVLHSLVDAKESHMAIEIFKNMKSDGFLPNAATYNVMVDCCSITRCYKSASALVSLMLRDGFSPQAVTYTGLIKILLECENFSEALNLLDQASSEGIVPDVLLFNTILQSACLKGKIDVIEYIVERMHREKIQPDASTCNHVLSAYVNVDLFNTGVEALQVVSMRMISDAVIVIDEESFIFCEEEDSEAESRILVQLFQNSEENVAAALFNLRWCAMLGFPISWFPNQTAWAKRLHTEYNKFPL